MSDNYNIFIDLILAIEAKRGHMRGITEVFEALDELEDDIRVIARKYGVKIQEPS